MFDLEVWGIPPGLDEMEPGPYLGVFLSGIDVTELSGHDRIVVLRAHQRMASHYQAQTYADMASVVDSMEDDNDPSWVMESAAAEIRAALRLTRRAADGELSFALELRQRLPRVWEALASGTIDVRQAKTIAYGTIHLTEATAREVVDWIIGEAPRLTTGQLHAAIRRICIHADPEEAASRYESAVAQGGWFSNRTHREPPTSRPRTSHPIAQLRSPAASTESPKASTPRTRHGPWTSYAPTSCWTSSRARPTPPADIRVDLETLAELADSPGDLGGYGPVIADIARQTTEQQTHVEWRYVVTDPDTGQTIHAGTTRRRPTAVQRRRVESREATCVFPGCRMPAADCDLDHRIRWADGGATDPANLTPLCRHDHRIRHHAGWQHQALPDGGHRWTRRLGHTYTTSGVPP